MNARRLLKLADTLDTVPRARFDFGVVFADNVVVNAEKSCGSVGCALGWANTIPAFRRAGFKLNSSDWNEAFYVAENFFGLDFAEVRHLFQPSYSYFRAAEDSDLLPETASPKQVANRIRKFVKEHS